MIGPMDEKSLLDTSSVFGMSSPGNAWQTRALLAGRLFDVQLELPGHWFSVWHNSAAPHSLGSTSMWFTETPLVWHHGWSLTHWHGLAGHDVVSGLYLPLPILWGTPQCGLQRPPWYGTMAGLSHISTVSLDMM